MRRDGKNNTPMKGGVKQCRRCHMWKQLENFYGDKGSDDGRKSWCAACHNQVTAVAYRRRRDRSHVTELEV